MHYEKLRRTQQDWSRAHRLIRLAGLVAALAIISALSVALPTRATQVAHAASLSNPPWWNGLCDSNRDPITGQFGGVAATWNGLQACFPETASGWVPYNPNGNQPDFSTYIPSADGVPNGAWECVELSERYLYLQYNLEALAADGSTLVDNYYSYYHASRPDLSKGTSNNGLLTSGVYPAVGDVVSITWANGGPHTAVVTNVNISGGNGTISLFQQNAYGGSGPWANGYVNVVNNRVEDTSYNALQKFDWLHVSANLGTTDRWVGRLASNGALIAFKGDTTGNVAYSYESAPGSASWSAWGQLPNPSQETFVGAPAVATNSDGRLFVFARSSTGSVWISTQSSTSSATSWSNLSAFSNPSGVTMASDPSVTASNNGALFLFVRDTSGVVRLQYQTTPGGAWLSSGYTQFSNPTGVTMAGNPMAVLGGDNKLYLFVRDTGGVIRLQNQTSPDGPWLSSGFTHFTNPSGVTMAGDPTAAPGGDGRLFLFVRDTGGVVRLQEQSGPGGAWMSSGYTQFSNPTGVTMAGNPTVIRSNAGDLYLFVRDTGGVIRLQYQTSPDGAWLSSGYTQFSNPTGVTMSDDPAAGVDSAGTLHLFDVGSDRHMYWAYQPTGSGWNALASIGGSLV